MITRENAVALQRKSQQQINERYIRTKSFPTRYVASAPYRRQLIVEVDTLYDQQVKRIQDTFATMESESQFGPWPAEYPFGFIPLAFRDTQSAERILYAPLEREYDCEVRR